MLVGQWSHSHVVTVNLIGRFYRVKSCNSLFYALLSLTARRVPMVASFSLSSINKEADIKPSVLQVKQKTVIDLVN